MLRFGWEAKSWFGQFVSVAAAVFALAFMYLAITHVLVWRYDSRIASGDLNPPALRSLPDADAVMVLGAQIGDVPDTVSLRALTGALKQASNLAMGSRPCPAQYARDIGDAAFGVHSGEWHGVGICVVCQAGQCAAGMCARYCQQ